MALWFAGSAQSTEPHRPGHAFCICNRTIQKLTRCFGVSGKGVGSKATPVCPPVRWLGMWACPSSAGGVKEDGSRTTPRRWRSGSQVLPHRVASSQWRVLLHRTSKSWLCHSPRPLHLLAGSTIQGAFPFSNKVTTFGLRQESPARRN